MVGCMVEEGEAATTCADCGEPIDERGATEREPCPKCGSKRRDHSIEVHDEVRVSDSVSVQVSRAVSAIRLAILATILTLGATAGFSAGFAKESVLLGLAWGIGAIVVSVLLLAFILRVGWVRQKTMAAMCWVAGE
jgi:predicted RNA-binding Zn-ribbon protein involved in translation (DUF1610 family)